MNYVWNNVNNQNSLTSLYTIGGKYRKAFVCNIQNYLDFSTTKRRDNFLLIPKKVSCNHEYYFFIF
jgi:hypothetical protein